MVENSYIAMQTIEKIKSLSSSLGTENLLDVLYNEVIFLLKV